MDVALYWIFLFKTLHTLRRTSTLICTGYVAGQLTAVRRDALRIVFLLDVISHSLALSDQIRETFAFT